MAEGSPSLADVVGVQLSCQRCPLYHNGPIPLSLPLHVSTAGLPLVVLGRPLGHAYSPRADARFRTLARLVPEINDFAATYVTNCRSQPGRPTPPRSVEACTLHRRLELASLAPPLIVTVGDDACRTYLGADCEGLDGGAWAHATGATVFVLSDVLDRPVPPEHVDLLTAYSRQVRAGMTYDFG